MHIDESVADSFLKIIESYVTSLGSYLFLGIAIGLSVCFIVSSISLDFVIRRELRNNKEKYINDFLDRNREHFDKLLINDKE